MSDQQVVGEVLRRESRTLLQYVRESFPWAKGKDAAVLANVLHSADVEGELLHRLSRLMQKQHLSLPAIGSFPSAFTNSNFVAISFLMPRLIATQRQTLADLERDLPKVHDPDLRVLLDALREAKLAHLSELESLPEKNGAVNPS